MASYEEMLKETTAILGKHVDLDRAISPKDHIQNDLGLDSLGVMEVVADIEDRFEVQIPQEMLGSISTVDDVVKALAQLEEKKKS
jgi:acyl carrier protein